jgi:hypothetical protein
LCLEKSNDLGHGFQEELSHLLAIQITSYQDECSHSSISQSISFKISISDTLIFCQYDLPSYTNFGKPHMILGILGEMVVVNMDDETCPPKGGCYKVLPKRAIEEKDGGLRLLRV